MHRCGDLFPGCYLRFVPDPGHVGESACALRDQCAFGYEECARDGGALGVVFHCQRGVDVGCVGTEAGEGREDYAVV